MDIQELYGMNPVKFTDLLEDFSLGHTQVTSQYLVDLIKTVPPKVFLQVLNTGAGIEVEVENCAGSRLTGFDRHEDPSLRNLGQEYVSQKGFRIYNIIPFLHALLDKAKEDKWTISDRTSIHVHLNVMNMTQSQLQALTILYSVFEDSLFQMISPHRSHNIFCTPLSETESISYNSLREFIDNGVKYAAFNVQAVLKYGTVEFRHMQTSYDFETVACWLFVLGLLRRYARQVPLEQIKIEVLELKTSSDYLSLMRKVFFGFVELLPVSMERMDRLVSFSKLFFFE